MVESGGSDARGYGPAWVREAPFFLLPLHSENKDLSYFQLPPLPLPLHPESKKDLTFSSPLPSQVAQTRVAMGPRGLCRWWRVVGLTRVAMGPRGSASPPSFCSLSTLKSISFLL